MLVAVAVGWDGRRSVLGVELANRESRSSWRDFLLRLKERGLHGIEFVVADDHAGSGGAARGAVGGGLPALLRAFPAQRPGLCAAQGRRRLPAELRWLYDRRDLGEARRISRPAGEVAGEVPEADQLVEDNIEETLTFYRLPRQHHKHMKSTNMLERLNEEIKRRTHVVRIFPNADSCLRLVRALAVEIHENWLEQHRYLNMEDLHEHQKEQLRLAA